MTDADLMEADCIHGKVWYECEQCDQMMDEALDPLCRLETEGED